MKKYYSPFFVQKYNPKERLETILNAFVEKNTQNSHIKINGIVRPTFGDHCFRGHYGHWWKTV